MILLFCQMLLKNKCACMVLGVDDELQTNLACGNETHKNSKQEKVLGVTIDNKLNLASHLSNIAENADIKFNELTKVQNYMTTDQKKKKKKATYSLILINFSSLITL